MGDKRKIRSMPFMDELYQVPLYGFHIRLNPWALPNSPMPYITRVSHTVHPYVPYSIFSYYINSVGHIAGIMSTSSHYTTIVHFGLMLLIIDASAFQFIILSFYPTYGYVEAYCCFYTCMTGVCNYLIWCLNMVF